jgi:hypothetical protein
MGVFLGILQSEAGYGDQGRRNWELAGYLLWFLSINAAMTMSWSASLSAGCAWTSKN